jgi:hypothetical protein
MSNSAFAEPAAFSIDFEWISLEEPASRTYESVLAMRTAEDPIRLSARHASAFAAAKRSGALRSATPLTIE